MVTFNETLPLRGLCLTPTMMLVFELYLAKRAVAGMPSREDLSAWTYCQALALGQVCGCFCVFVCVGGYDRMYQAVNLVDCVSVTTRRPTEVIQCFTCECVTRLP